MQDTPTPRKYEMQNVKSKKKGRISLSHTSQTVLLRQPVLTPVMVSLENPDQATVAIRVDDLFSFRRQNLPIVTKLVGYQAKEGIWVVAIAFAVARNTTTCWESAVYINPRQPADYQLLQQLAEQERVPFLFLSPRLKVIVEQHTDWSVLQRQEVRVLLTRVDHTLLGNDSVGGIDTEFVRARTEFQALYSVKTLLTMRPYGAGRSSSSFGGVVLD